MFHIYILTLAVLIKKSIQINISRYWTWRISRHLCGNFAKYSQNGEMGIDSRRRNEVVSKIKGGSPLLRRDPKPISPFGLYFAKFPHRWREMRQVQFHNHGAESIAKLTRQTQNIYMKHNIHDKYIMFTIYIYTYWNLSITLNLFK